MGSILLPSPAGAFLLLLCLRGAFALPLTTQLSEEDEKVTKCITEVLADALSGPRPDPVTGECMKLLREDERVLAMLHHQHLLSELEELAHQENAKHRLSYKGSHEAWEGENGEQEEVKKRDMKPVLQGEAATTEKMREQSGGRKEEELKEYEKTEKTEEKVKEEKVSEGEAHRQALEEQVKELMEEEEEGKKEEEEEEARKKKKKRGDSSETWSSQEYFGHVKNRGPGRPKIREGMLQGDQGERKRNGLDKRRFKLEEEDEEDESKEEEPRKQRHRGFDEGRHHEDWEEAEEEVKKRRPYLAKRVAEKASDEETSQFEEEEKGVKISNPQGHLHGGWKPWQEEEREEEGGGSKHRHHHKSSGLDLKKRHEDAVYLKGRYHSHDAEEEGREAGPDEELKKLEEIEEELKRAAERLEKLRKG